MSKQALFFVVLVPFFAFGADQQQVNDNHTTSTSTTCTSTSSEIVQMAASSSDPLIRGLVETFLHAPRKELEALVMFSALRPDQQKFILEGRMQQHESESTTTKQQADATESDDDELSTTLEPMPTALAQSVLQNAPVEARKLLHLLRRNRKVRVIFLGEPGTGKTSTAQALADLSGRKSVLVNAAELTTKWRSSGSVNLAKRIHTCLSSCEPSLIILDEMNRLVGDGRDTSAADRLVPIMNSVARSSKVAFIATANTLDDVPLAIKSRFHGETGIIKFPMPGVEALKSVIQYCINAQNDGQEVFTIDTNCTDNAFLTRLARNLQGCTQRDVAAMVDKAFDNCVLSMPTETNIRVRQADIEGTIREEVKKRGNGVFVSVQRFCLAHPVLVDYGVRATSFGIQFGASCVFQYLNMRMTGRHHALSHGLAVAQAVFSVRNANRAYNQTERLHKATQDLTIQLQQQSYDKQQEWRKKDEQTRQRLEEKDDNRYEAANPKSWKKWAAKEGLNTAEQALVASAGSVAATLMTSEDARSFAKGGLKYIFSSLTAKCVLL